MDKIVLHGRGVIPGIAEGIALVCPRSITGWAGVDPATGVITDFANEHRGTSIKDRILVLPGSKGSNGWSCYFSACHVAGTDPAGWMFTRIDSAAGVASAVMNIPTVVDFPDTEDPCKWIQTGDWVRIDGTSGIVEVTRQSDSPENA